MPLSSVLAMRPASGTRGPMAGAIEAFSATKMAHTLRTVRPALHQKLLTRLLHEMIAERISSVLVVPRPSKFDDALTRLQEASALQRLQSTLDMIPSQFKDKILNDLLGEILAARWDFRSPYLRNPRPTSTTMIRRKETILNILPAEIRIKIFNYALANEWNGTVPNLIKALRTELEIYAEAVEIFFRPEQIFMLHKGNNWSFYDMPEEMLPTIGRVKIVLRDGYDDPGWDNDNGQPGPNSVYLATQFEKCTNVREVDIESTWGAKGVWPCPIEKHFTKLLAGFQGLNKVVFTFPNNLMAQDQLFMAGEPLEDDGSDDNGSDDSFDDDTEFACPIARANLVLGTMGRTTEVLTLTKYPESRMLLEYPSTTESYEGYIVIAHDVRAIWVAGLKPLQMETWFWEAAKGKFLKQVCICEAAWNYTGEHNHTVEVEDPGEVF